MGRGEEAIAALSDRICMKLLPRAAIWSSITLLAPRPAADAAITAPTPMMIPRIVRKDLVLLAASDLIATLRISRKGMLPKIIVGYR